MEISSSNTTLPFTKPNSGTDAAGQRLTRGAQAQQGNNANTSINSPNTTQRPAPSREATTPRAPDQANNSERTGREFAERPTTTSREQSQRSEREAIDAIELRPLVVEANSSPATRAFLDVAQPSRDNFQIIDIYV